jgi:Tfp pilus assembly protein PilO
VSRNRLMLVLAGLAAVVVLAGGFFLGVRPQLDRAAAARSDASSIDATNEVTRAELARLRDQAKTLPQQKSGLSALRQSVPSTASSSAFISALNATADQAGVKVSSLTVGDAEAYMPPVTVDAGSTGASGSATATPSPSVTPAPATGAAQIPAALAPTTSSSITAQNFSVVPVSVSVNGDFAQALAFVKGVQAGDRLFLITSISSSMSASSESSESDGAESSTPSWSFSGSVYVLADEAAAGASATATPAPAG